ncbi:MULTISPECIES: DUF2079 domain-containing protein [Corallococcus]|uniref:DUF2079 domain-containing protein n=1 Tax=Corallococcus TaxID=83461 RepID=UPI0018F5A366|nr:MULTISPECIES: DUF2079 domain-containing protein [Corallococcus]
MTSTPTPDSSRRALPGLLVLFALVLLWAVVAVAPVWLQAARSCFATYDLGIYAQALARMSLSDPNPWLSARQVFIFADHFDPVLWLARPLGALLPAMWAGLLAEALFVVLSLAPLVWLYVRGLLDRASTVFLGAVLLFNTGTLAALIYPIHPTTWAMLPWTWFAVAYCLRRTGWMFAALVLLFACKEEFAFVGLMLAGGLWLRGERRIALWVFTLSVAWLAFVFFGRSALWGETVNYRTRLSPTAGQGLGAYLAERFALEHLRRIGTLLTVFIPVGLWAWRQKWKPDWVWLSLLLPMIGIRFLGMAWRAQYGAPLMAAALMALLPLLLRRGPPPWVLLTTGVLLFTTNQNLLRSSWRSVSRSESLPAHCPATPARLDALQRAKDVLAVNQGGKVLLGGNLVPDVASRDDIYMVGGPQPDGVLIYDLVLVEKPPLGIPAPVTPERLGELIDLWRSQPDTQVLIDDAHVFLARGRFTVVR